MRGKSESGLQTKTIVAGAVLGLLVASMGCSSSADTAANGVSAGGDDTVGSPCNPDENGAAGGPTVVIKLSVSDTAFTVGAAGHGPGEPNITSENAATVVLTMTNVGTKPHDFTIECLATPNIPACPALSCFPTGANLPPVMPGASASVMFTTPVHEGAYRFTSDLPGDTTTAADGTVTGLVGHFVLM